MATISMNEIGVGNDKCKVLIVDDHPIIRQGLARMIAQEPDITVCGGADNVADAMEQVRSEHPDVVVVDMSLKDSYGIDLISQVKAFDERIRLIVWSMFDDKIFAERALRAGAMGYVNKRESVASVVDGIRQVMRGEVYLCARMTSRLLHRLAGDQSIGQDPVAELTDREVEVFHMIGQGMTTQEIGRKLGLKPKTIESHRENIKAKLSLKNAAELNCRAVQWVMENT
jgi:DNA-binding NarL/FixJ family response regulator